MDVVLQPGEVADRFASNGVSRVYLRLEIMVSHHRLELNGRL
jgi:hypothetical protein